MSRAATGSGRALAAYLVVTAMACGALVMVIEVLGSRVIGPFFGVSLFVWTALITVTLLALAAGYAAGGWLADRYTNPEALYAVILVAGAAVLAIPFAKAAVLKASLPLGLRAGSFAAALLLFGPALFLLGCVTPWLVRLLAREPSRLGWTVGVLYALSTLGSFAGTVGTGFLLIAWLGVDRILQATAAALIALAAGYFAFFRRRVLVLAALGVPVLIQPAPGAREKTLADGTVARLVHSRDSFYGNVRVVDYHYGELHTRELMIDGLIQGGMDMKTGESVYEYAYLLQWLPFAARPDGTDCLVIGLGVGAVPRWFAGRGVRTDVVELDPAVAALAQEYFGAAGAEVHLADARQYLAATRRRYDYLIMDAYTGDATPGHLLSAEAIGLIKARLKPGGVAAFNLHGGLGREHGMTRAILRTIRSAFREMWIYPLYAHAPGQTWGNIVVIAGDALPDPPPAAAFARLPVHRLAEKAVRASLRAPSAPPDLRGALLLTDDYNPVDLYDLPLKEAVRRNALAVTDRDLLLN
jgi:spermidine synthase